MEHNAGVQTTNMGEVRLECLNVHALVLVFLKKRCFILFSKLHCFIKNPPKIQDQGSQAAGSKEIFKVDSRSCRL